MKLVVNNELTQNKPLIYEESFWIGKKSLTYDGVVLTKTKNNIYEYKTENETHEFVVKGSYYFGVSITMFGKEVQLSRKLFWYEIFLAVLTIIPGLLFGAVGGAIAGILGVTSLFLIKNADKIWQKILIALAFLGTVYIASSTIASLVAILLI